LRIEFKLISYFYTFIRNVEKISGHCYPLLYGYLSFLPEFEVARALDGELKANLISEGIIQTEKQHLS